VQWNVHQAVDLDAKLDPEGVASAIAAQGRVDVVVLNEVGRGWPLTGQLDLATWLSRRFDLPFLW
jgi:endonuclease/exonuclease/phosphatase family metal-dependent hydrolase